MADNFLANVSRSNVTPLLAGAMRLQAEVQHSLLIQCADYRTITLTHFEYAGLTELDDVVSYCWILEVFLQR